ncbi:MFS transporter [Alteromonas sp. KC3]|uniref:MFS transporter n=1 Tax=unclassified Alteromonas TaxID=2614992 RepID=UPI0019357231|nr:MULTISPECIES: MFS transporter [unclassified Alteromonas]BCO17410.1 MFS transporter [Alteromonas sp. KC3]BCO21400.1 MFS transporter [Alteromonas sp. KC14]
MSRLMIIAAIAISYYVFAILLNSVGTVILQSINSFDISKPQASTLEGFKDLSIAIVSFLVASFIPRVGYKLAMLVGLALVTVACALTPSIASFWFIKVLFASIGTAFALVKVSVYAIIGQLSSSTKAHSSLMNTIEGIFMLGVLSGYWVFAGFIDPNNDASLSWLNVYYLLAALVAFTCMVVAIAPIKRVEYTQGSTLGSEFVGMLKLAYKPLVLVFIFSIFLYVLIEQGIGSWLPTFNKEVLGLPTQVSIQITSIFAIALAVGRLTAGAVLTRMNWYPFLNICLAGMALVMLLSLPLAENVANMPIASWADAPLAAFLIPLIGLMMAPIYPVINSVMLSALPQAQHAPMTGLIVVFSALGGTTGSIVTGFVFDAVGGQQAFYLSLIPIGLLVITLFFFKKASTTLTEKALSPQRNSEHPA